MNPAPLLDFIERNPIPPISFRGTTYNAAFDHERLNAQQTRVHDAMIDGVWRTLSEIKLITGDPEASISARLRDFNNHEYLKQFFSMVHRRRGEPKHGLFEYQVKQVRA